ncbi:MAG: peptidylprolyl isomerase [Gammaproteobacteria bacterium]|nr:peptidylprolyl isomerase [Gammaproteobacteria bacterium]
MQSQFRAYPLGFIKNPLRWFFLGLLVINANPATAARQKVVELDHIVAIVNDDVITASELQKRIQLLIKQMGDKASELPETAVLRRQLLDRLIIEQLQLQLAKRSNIRIDDEYLTTVIGNIARGNKLSLDQFREVLAKDGISFSEFRDQIRNELTITQLRRARVDSTITVSEQEVDNQLSRMSDQQDMEYHLAQILVSLPEGADATAIENAQHKAKTILAKLDAGADFSQTAMISSDAAQALQGGDLGWLKQGQLPTVMVDTVTAMHAGQIAGPLRSASGFHIIKLIEKRSQEAKHIVEQTLARHILIKTDQITTDSVARERLERLRSRILAGEDFAQLARANSADSASGADGGNLGWISPGAMVPEFEEVMAKLKPGEISEPFQSRYGWHIVQVMSRRTYDDTKEYQRNQARQLIMQRKTAEETESWIRRLRAEAYVDIRLGQ